MDQSASEVDDNISPHLDRITKDQLYSAYRKIRAKYHKYRDRYSDLATHYRDLDKVKSRLESVLVETQDKVLRRINDLKEQCQLEQQAKAHLEEALRNDIEEKDHIINALNTKVKLLQASGPALENSVPENPEQKESSKANLIDLTNELSNDENSALSAENIQLKDKLKKLESLVLKYKESLRRNKEKFTEVMKEKNGLENDYEALTNSTAEKMGFMEGELSTARVEIGKLTERVDILQKREEESAISLAENKLSVHRELEEKEEQIKQLRIDLKETTENAEHLNEVIARYKVELDKLKSQTKTNLAADKNTKVHTYDTAQAGIKHYEQIDHDKEARSGEDENTLEKVMLRLKEKEIEFQELQRQLDELEKRNVEYKHDNKTLVDELSLYKVTCSEMKNEYDAQRIVTAERQKDADATIEKLQATVQSVDKELENMRRALVDRDQVCENYNKKVQQYVGMLEKAKHRLSEQETQIKSLKEKLEDKTEISKIHEESEKKKAELKAAKSELELCKSTIDDLTNKLQADSSAISLLKKERSDLLNRLVYYNNCVQCLKRDCADVRGIAKKEFSSQKASMSHLNSALATSLAKFEEENSLLMSQAHELRSRINDWEQFTSKEAELQSELAKMINLKSSLEAELKKSDERLKEMTNERVKEMTLKDERYNELNITNNKLIAEIDNLHFKVYDAEKTARKLMQSQQQVEALQERLRALENLESVNCALSIEIDDLREKHAQASCAFGEMDELKTKLREATDIISSMKLESGDQDARLREELHVLKLEIARLKDELTEKESEVRIREEKLVEEEEHIAHLKSTCDSHIQTIEEHVKKYLNLEAEYQATREAHAKENVELMENNKVLQETINVKLVQLKKMKIVKERQGKTIEELNSELDQLRSKHADLSDTLETWKKQIESLKLENSQLATIILENKDLKDKCNDLLSRNEKLGENEEALKQKVKIYEKDIEELRRMVRDCIESRESQLNSRNEETERLNSQLTIVNTQLVCKDTELNSLNERLAMSERELQEVREKFNLQNIELQDKVAKLSVALTTGNTAKDENAQLFAELKALRDQIERLKRVENENAELKSELGDLTRKNCDVEAMCSENNRLIAEQTILKGRIVELENANSSNTELQIYINNLQSKISSLESLQLENDRLQSEMETLRSANSLSTELSSLRDLLTAKDVEVKLLEDKNSNMSQEIGNLRRFSSEVDGRRKEADTLRNSLARSEEKLVDLQTEINSLLRANDALRNELEAVRNDKDNRCQLDSDKLREENKRLEAQLDETLITFQAKETQMQLVSGELKAQANQLREQLKTNEEEQGMRLKQLVKEFQAQLHDKEEELQAALEKRFGKVLNSKVIF